MEQTSLESQSRGCAKIPILEVRYLGEEPIVVCINVLINVLIVQHSINNDLYPFYDHIIVVLIPQSLYTCFHKCIPGISL